MGCTTSLVKYLVFLSNLIFALAGLGLIVIGVLFKLDVDGYQSVLQKVSYLSLAPTILIGVGSIIFIIAFFGCCGALKEGTCLLTTYAVILLSIFIIQVAVAVFAFLQFKDDSSQLKSSIKTEMYNSLSNYEQTANRETFDLLQRNLHCCGVDNPSDWATIFHNGSYPISCCQSKVNGGETCNSSNSYKEGCLSAVWKFLKEKNHTLGYVVIAIAAVEIMGAIFALCLVSSIRNAYRRSNYA